ncbi:MAG: proline--tRNA ligase [Erysipelotrichales bacterium]|nr:proline--tRNA ligase [Erysipelotrichales bacterium]
MKLNNSFFYTLRENVKDEDSISGNLLVRAGMVKKSSTGIYMIMPMGHRVLKKIEGIIREEMNAAGAQELLMPSLILEETYEKTGRRENFGSNMFSLKDRYGKNYVLGPTHEELFTIAAGMNAASYKDFPYNLYQIQTKFRDETRPRYGLIRVREFIMKDAYSFDKDMDGMQVSYDKMFNAYKNCFDRMGIDYKIVRADTGAMGGLLSEEFQAVTDIGEDTLVFCDDCDFASNLEIAAVVDNGKDDEAAMEEMAEVHTPDAKTIEEVSAFMGADATKFVKTLIYKADDKLVACLVRGDRELNETKVMKLLKVTNLEMAAFADVEDLTKAKVGYAGPVNLPCDIIVDNEVMHMRNMIVGANKSEYHLKNVNVHRDFEPTIVADIRNISEDDVCPCCGKKLVFKKGIEIGNTFKLGTKYSEAMNIKYLDADNKLQPIQMGCYGIGLGRCMSAIAEQTCDENGLNWPVSVAPYTVAVVLISSKFEDQVNTANALYNEFTKAGIDVLLDDRDERAGVKFKDMDLIGVPYRITCGKKCNEGIVEFKGRNDEAAREVTVEEAIKLIKELVK